MTRVSTRAEGLPAGGVVPDSDAAFFAIGHQCTPGGGLFKSRTAGKWRGEAQEIGLARAETLRRREERVGGPEGWHVLLPLSIQFSASLRLSARYNCSWARCPCYEERRARRRLNAVRREGLGGRLRWANSAGGGWAAGPRALAGGPRCL